MEKKKIYFYRDPNEIKKKHFTADCIEFATAETNLCVVVSEALTAHWIKFYMIELLPPPSKFCGNYHTTSLAKLLIVVLAVQRLKVL